MYMHRVCVCDTHHFNPSCRFASLRLLMSNVGPSQSPALHSPVAYAPPFDAQISRSGWNSSMACFRT